MPRFPYQFFENYVIRTPLYSYKNFKEVTDKENFSDERLREICLDSIFQEAIYLASPNLHQELNQWLYSEKELSQNLKNTIIKYYSRISTRCTPFGLFSGVSSGKFIKENINQNILNDVQTPIRDTKFDMHFLVSLAKTLEKSPNIKNQLLYFPNNSIYRIGKRIRYVEYEYKEGKRDYIISSVPYSKELSRILDLSKQGITADKLVEILVDQEIDKEEAREFIEELIDNQVLVSELEPNVSEYDYLDVIISVLHKIKAKDEAEILLKIKDKLDHLDSNIGNSISLYSEIENIITNFKAEYEKKYLFQTDLYFKEQFTVSNHWKKEIRTGMKFLNKITSPNRDTAIEHFKKAFYERFETQEMPLSYVLDTEIGIGYLQNATARGIHTYLDDLQFPNLQKKQDIQIRLSPFHRMLNEKLQEALLENQFIISLNDDDIKDLEEQWDDLPETFSVMAEIISENNSEKLYIGNIGGSTAANLLGRFSSEKSDIHYLAKDISEKEKTLRSEVNDSEIPAEIIHLPEARIGNIIRRRTLRQYEIPYLATSMLTEEKQIFVDDLYISLKNDKIVLRSKKLDKEVKPYLTNAHNYHHNSLPVYHFLCDLHSQNTRTGLNFNWGGLSQIYKFFPRVEYSNIIMAKAQWIITEKDIIMLQPLIHNKDKFLSEVEIWRKKRLMPQWLQWVRADNTLPVNLKNYDMAKLFMQVIKTEKTITIEEFLHNKNDNFKREFIFPMYQEKK